MIHLNKGEDQPHEWVTEEEFERRFPLFLKKIQKQFDPNEHGQKLKALRLKKRVTIRELSLHSKLGAAEICDYENGRKPITPEINDRYCIALNYCQGSPQPE